jgi:hypothetical protein
MFEKLKSHFEAWKVIYTLSGLSLMLSVLLAIAAINVAVQVTAEVKKAGLKNIVHDVWEGEGGNESGQEIKLGSSSQQQ